MILILLGPDTENEKDLAPLLATSTSDTNEKTNSVYLVLAR